MNCDGETDMKNLIFDMGGVLITYDPEYFLTRSGIVDADDRAMLLGAVFRSPEWGMLDNGTLDEAGLEPIALSRLPERLHAVARSLIWEWFRPLEPIPGMAELIAAYKARGCGIYLLSNASYMQPEYWPDIPGSGLFDGAVVSALEKRVKPEPEIFHILLDRYGLRAEDCVFIDDMQKNVDAAEAVGIKGIRFDGSAEHLRNQLDTIIGDKSYT